MAPGEFDRRLAQATDHLRFMFSLFELQISLGGYILFEHPRDATSWTLDFVQAMRWRPGMKFIITHMCRFGMTGRDQLGQGLLLKPTGFLTDCPALAATLDRQCTGGHRHISSFNAGGLAQFAIYLPRLGQAIAGG